MSDEFWDFYVKYMYENIDINVDHFNSESGLQHSNQSIKLIGNYNNKLGIKVQVNGLTVHSIKLPQHFIKKRKHYLSTKKQTLSNKNAKEWTKSVLFGNYQDFLLSFQPPQLLWKEGIIAWAALEYPEKIEEINYKPRSFKDLFVLIENSSFDSMKADMIFSTHTLYENEKVIPLYFIQLLLAYFLQSIYGNTHKMMWQSLHPEKHLSLRLISITTCLALFLIFKGYCLDSILLERDINKLKKIISSYLNVLKSVNVFMPIDWDMVAPMSEVILKMNFRFNKTIRNVIIISFEKYQKLIKNNDNLHCNSINWGDSCCDYIHYAVAKVYFKENKYQKAHKYFMCAVCSAGSIYARIIMLKYLSYTSFHLNQYQLSLKCVYTAYKLSYFPNGTHINKTFVNQLYRIRKKEIKHRLKEMSCAQCDQYIKSLNTCTGCMITMYCSKRCQKKHWKHCHQLTCLNSLSNDYKTLKTIVFDRL
eukprot:441236_1